MMLLRYTVMQCGARSGALFGCGPGGELVHLTHTEGWSPAAQGLDALWREARGALATGEPQRGDELLLWPLFDSRGALAVVVALAGLGEAYAPTASHRDLFERLRLEVTSRLPRDPLRAVLAALALLVPRWSTPRAAAA